MGWHERCGARDLTFSTIQIEPIGLIRLKLNETMNSNLNTYCYFSNYYNLDMLMGIVYIFKDSFVSLESP